MNYYLNRWYDSRVGRWLSEDPAGFAAGDANLTRYVGNSPTMYVDPLGLVQAFAQNGSANTTSDGALAEEDGPRDLPPGYSIDPETLWNPDRTADEKSLVDYSPSELSAWYDSNYGHSPLEEAIRRAKAEYEAMLIEPGFIDGFLGTLGDLPGEVLDQVNPVTIWNEFTGLFNGDLWKSDWEKIKSFASDPLSYLDERKEVIEDHLSEPENQGALLARIVEAVVVRKIVKTVTPGDGQGLRIESYGR